MMIELIFVTKRGHLLVALGFHQNSDQAVFSLGLVKGCILKRDIEIQKCELRPKSQQIYIPLISSWRESTPYLQDTFYATKIYWCI